MGEYVCVRSKFDKGYVLRSTHCETAAVRPQDIPRCGRPAPGLAPTQHLCIVFQSRVRVLDVIRNAHSAAYVFHRVLKYWAGCGWKKVNFREEMDQRLPQPMIMPIAFPHLRLLWWKNSAKILRISVSQFQNEPYTDCIVYETFE